MWSWLFIILCLSFVNDITGMSKDAPEYEQELSNHYEVDFDLDFVLDALGFQKEKIVYSNIRQPGIDGHPPLQRAVMMGNVEAAREIACHPILALNREQQCLSVHRAMLNAAMFSGDIKKVEECCRSPVLRLSEEEREFLIMKTRFFNILTALGFSPGSRVFFDINARDEETGDWPLIRAVLRRDIEIVKALLTLENLNLNQSDRYGTTALIQAIALHDNNIVEELIKDDHQRIYNGFYLNINCHDCVGLTPLMWAIKVNNEQAIRWLCADRRLDLAKIDKQGWSVIDWACKMDNQCACEYLNQLMKQNIIIDQVSNIPKTPRYQSRSAQSLQELVSISPRLSTLVPAFSEPILPILVKSSFSDQLQNSL